MDALRDWILQPVECDWICPHPCSRCWESEVEVERSAERLEAGVAFWKQTSAALCAGLNHYMQRCGELSSGRRKKVDRSALYAELPLSPTVEQKKAAATKHGITLHQVTRLVRARGVPVRVQGKFSRDF